MVVDQNDGAGRKLQCAAHDLAWVDRRMIDGAVVHHLVGDQLVLLVQIENVLRR